MTHLYELIQQNVATWRKDGYPHADYSAIAEILDYAILPENKSLRFLRAAQLRALETYWYLRLVEGTPHTFDLAHKLESVHETLTLDYPSYILALAMGAGKTMFIGQARDLRGLGRPRRSRDARFRDDAVDGQNGKAMAVQ
ncbi:MAG: hypothetical protein ACOYZ7_03835 [Chloroflexota bacterium]